jgi:hypothetical protein
MEETVDAFAAAFRTVGFELCENGKPEPGIEKIAIYALSGKPKHAARQLEDGSWTSKCGRGEDISHTLDGLEGAEYGEPIAFLSRPRSVNP